MAPNYDFDPAAVQKMLTWHLRRHREYNQLQPADQEDVLAMAMEIVVKSYHTYDPAKSKLTTWTKLVARSALFRRRAERKTVKRGLGREVISIDDVADQHDGHQAVLPQMWTVSHENTSVDRLAITERLKRLQPRERRIIELRYFEDKTLEEVGSFFGIGRERIRQIEARTLGKLRAHLFPGKEGQKVEQPKPRHVSHRVPLEPHDEALLVMVVERKTLKEIAAALSVSQETARHRRSMLLEKIGARDYSGAAGYLENVHKRPVEVPPTASAKETSRRVVHQKAKGPIDPTLGKKVREIRLARGMTQGELAGDDFTKGFISLVENGRTRISLRAGEIFAARLGVPLSILLPAGSAKTSLLPNGLDGQIQEVLSLLRQGSQFSSSAFTAMLGISKDYTRIKAGVGKIQKLLSEAPAPDFNPADVEGWMKSYATWLRLIRSQLEVAEETEEAAKV